MIWSSPLKGLLGLLTSLGIILTACPLSPNSWQKRFDRAFLQVDGMTPQGRIRCLQRALRDPELRTDLSKAIDAIREKGFGKGHPQLIEILWPEGTQARRDLEAISALAKQIPERRTELLLTESSSLSSQDLFNIFQSTQEQLRFGGEGPGALVTALVKQIQSDPNRTRRLAENILRNSPKEVESPSYKLLGKYSLQENCLSQSSDDAEKKSTNSALKKKPVLTTVPPLELRQYDAFRTVSVPLRPSGSSSSLITDGTFTLKSMGSALAEIFSYLELGNNVGSTLIPMTTPFFISDGNIINNGTNDNYTMFVKLSPKEHHPKSPMESSSRIAITDFPETILATLSFPGICTDEEIKRQKKNLMERVEKAGDIGWNIRRKERSDPQSDDEEQIEVTNNKENGPAILVLQYNPPGTLPWRRMNEIAVVMENSDARVNIMDETVVAAESDIDQSHL